MQGAQVGQAEDFSAIADEPRLPGGLVYGDDGPVGANRGERYGGEPRPGSQVEHPKGFGPPGIGGEFGLLGPAQKRERIRVMFDCRFPRFGDAGQVETAVRFDEHLVVSPEDVEGAAGDGEFEPASGLFEVVQENFASAHVGIMIGSRASVQCGRKRVGVARRERLLYDVQLDRLKKRMAN